MIVLRCGFQDYAKKSMMMYLLIQSYVRSVEYECDNSAVGCSEVCRAEDEICGAIEGTNIDLTILSIRKVGKRHIQVD